MPVIGFAEVTAVTVVVLFLSARHGVWLAGRKAIWIWAIYGLHAAGLSITGVVAGIEKILAWLPW